jgi:hypothetical protein
MAMSNRSSDLAPVLQNKLEAIAAYAADETDCVQVGDKIATSSSREAKVRMSVKVSDCGRRSGAW